MIPQPTVYRGLAVTVAAMVLGAVVMSRGTLDDRAIGAVLVVGSPVPIVILTGLAERWGAALLAGFGAATVGAVGWVVGVSLQAGNTPICRECGTCCEGAAMVTFLGIPLLVGMELVWLPTGSALVRGGALLVRRLRRR